jgi:transposase InsO family protein
VVIEHARHGVLVAGITAYPAVAWVTQQARNMLMDLGDHAARFRFLIRDRDRKFTAKRDAVFTGANIRIIRTPVRAPRANAIAERFIGTLRRMPRSSPDHRTAPPRGGVGRVHRALRHPPSAPIAPSAAARRPAPIGPPLRPSGRCDETGSVAFYTNTNRPHNVTEVSVPTR